MAYSLANPKTQNLQVEISRYVESERWGVPVGDRGRNWRHTNMRGLRRLVLIVMTLNIIFSLSAPLLEGDPKIIKA